MRPGVPPDGDPWVRAGLLHDSERTRVTRLLVDGQAVIRKEPLGPDASRRVQHERAVLERLRGVEGVAQLAELPQEPGSILLEDVGGLSVAELVKPLPVEDLLGIARGLARAVAGIHRRGVVHLDISPANIVVSRNGVPCLADFAVAMSVAEIRPEFRHQAEIVGTLAYLAPECTGRTGRPVDQRADLYALGATLYELATGAPPFGAGNALRLIGDHLARVPMRPAEANWAVPRLLSEIILHLLDKEPDHRYQTADGVVYDLERLGETETALRVGEHDVPLRLVAPSRLVGRDAEINALRAAFDDALADRCRGVLVAGAPGVGKTALVDQLRSMVTDRDGWFVAGKFDQYRRDLEHDAGYQAFRALGRLLLAEPEQELAAVRSRILRAVGANAGLLTAINPEFAALLAVPPAAGDPLTAQLRIQRAGVEILRAVASGTRPLVMFFDDLQWTSDVDLGFVDLVLSEEPVEGLLLVSAYRDSDVDTTHPLAGPLARWREQGDVRQLRLGNLPTPGLVAMVAEILHVDPAAAAGLVEVFEPYTSGNPYETVELLNALRANGLLTPAVAGWQWDTTAVHAYLGRPEVAALGAARMQALPPPSQQLVEATACLGGRVEVRVLRAATGEPAGVVEQRLAPALGEGLLLSEPGAHEAVRFPHDRTRETVLNGLDPQRRRALQLAMARRLAGVAELFAVAAEQYLAVVDAVDNAGERRAVVGLLRRAADQARVIGDYALVNRLLDAALPLIDAAETATLIDVHTLRHAALYGMRRVAEADEEYYKIDMLSRSASERAAATAVQVRSLAHRNRCFAEATELGVRSLRDLGIAVPSPDRLAAELESQWDHLYRWFERIDAAESDLARPEITDPTLLAAIEVLNATLPAAYQGDQALLCWLSLEAVRIWDEHGLDSRLVYPAAVAAFTAIWGRDDDAVGYRAARRVLVLAEARGYEPGTALVRYVFAVLLDCWFEPLENAVQRAGQARAGLVAAGDLSNAAYIYVASVSALLDCGATLDEVRAEAVAGLAFVRRIGGDDVAQWLGHYPWLVEVLRGQRSVAATEPEPVPVHRYANQQHRLLVSHIVRALAAAIFGDADRLDRHSAAAMPLLVVIPGLYPTAVARLLRGLSVARQAGAADEGQRVGLLAELDEVIGWLAARAVHAPDNFLHLVRLLEAERAWALGDFRAAAVAFDAARHAVASRHRPWHQALIAERAAQFHLDHHMTKAGHALLTEARQIYAAWGATAKVAEMDWAYSALRPGADATNATAEPDADQPAHQPSDAVHRRSTVTTGMLDLLAILSASQALSSETNIEGLHARVAEVLGAMTGATDVHLLLFGQDRGDWLLPVPGGGMVPVGEVGQDQVVPMSALRYAQRTGEPLLVTDATADDRFARDPYFTNFDWCSLLALPIFSRGALRAVLLLENRLIRGAFTIERLDAVKLITCQLAVSLDNAQLYAQLTTSRARIIAAADAARRGIERNLHDGAQQRLVTLALHLRAAKKTVPREASELTARLDALVNEATSTLDELRELARGIHPAVLAEGGLGPALKVLARRSAVPVELTVEAEGRLPDQIEIAAYYMVSEALTNTAKHAQASTVTVTAHVADHLLHMAVRDNGVGGANLTHGSGLVGLKDRIEALGGQIFLDSPPGIGTNLRAELPLHRR